MRVSFTRIAILYHMQTLGETVHVLFNYILEKWINFTVAEEQITNFHTFIRTYVHVYTWLILCAIYTCSYMYSWSVFQNFLHYMCCPLIHRYKIRQPLVQIRKVMMDYQDQKGAVKALNSLQSRDVVGTQLYIH